METDTVAELVTQALAALRAATDPDDSEDPDDRDAWHEYAPLLWRAGADGTAALPFGLELIGSADPIEREAGCDLLRDTSSQHEAVRAGAASALVALAQRETQDRVLQSLARAIGMTYDPRAVPVLVTLAGHCGAEVREEVARSFAQVLTGLPDGPDIHTLIRLTQDPHPRVRDWATFTLGVQAEVDSHAIRAALWERTTDEHAETRTEAIRALACRHDPRAVPLLAELLGNPEGSHVLTFSAAQNTGVPEPLPALLEYEPGGDWVTDAVNACNPARRGPPGRLGLGAGLHTPPAPPRPERRRLDGTVRLGPLPRRRRRLRAIGLRHRSTAQTRGRQPHSRCRTGRDRPAENPARLPSRPSASVIKRDRDGGRCAGSVVVPDPGGQRKDALGNEISRHPASRRELWPRRSSAWPVPTGSAIRSGHAGYRRRLQKNRECEAP
ncbi:HEAT repeat domain-containing protein [Streptomyces sp. TE33382]